MSGANSQRSILVLKVAGAEGAPELGAGAEIFELTETNGAEALEKIFAAETVMVWGKVEGELRN
jgi:hypothetical protein